MLGLSSLQQYTPLRSSLSGANQKKRKSISIAGPSAFDEENAPNKSTNISSDTSGLSKKTKVTKMADYKVSPIDAESEYLKSQYMCPKPSPNKSDCGTEVSVSERREWLKKFEQKQTSNAFRGLDKEKERKNDDRNNSETSLESKKEKRESPPASIGSAHSARSIPVETNPPVISAAILKPVSAKKVQRTRLVNNRRASSGAVPSWVAQKKVDVKATDEGFASVASLSKWLENDPTSVKKMRHVRRGRNIVSKSRQFEAGNDNIIFEAKISRGAVGDKKKWLQSAFQSNGEDNEDDACSSFSGYVKSDVGGSMRTYPRFNQRYGAQTEIITDDAASSLSVSDKTEWLKTAFKKNADERKSLGYNKAQTDVMHNRGQDEAVSRAKLRFKERSARKLLASNATTRPSASDECAVQPIEEDTTPVDFSAAREALVHRSNKNGHDTQVVNKVYLQKKKIERRDDESRRKSVNVGLTLKPSWELAEDSNGNYQKKYVPVMDVAPKKSFEDLP